MGTHEISEVMDDYSDYDNEYVDGATANYSSKSVPHANLDGIKESLISEIMTVYNADKANFMKMHEVENAKILDELKQVKEENSKLKAAFDAANNTNSAQDRRIS